MTAPSVIHEEAMRTLAFGMAAFEQAAHAEFLRNVIQAAAGGLLVLEGPRAAAEVLYRAGDAVVGAKP